MTITPVRRRLSLAAVSATGAAALLASLALAPGVTASATTTAPVSAGAVAAAAASTPLKGTLLLTPGAYDATTKKARGSYFRMILPGGTDAYFTNNDSLAADKTYTLFVPGSDGGLKLGSYQQPVTPAFVNGDAQTAKIIRPLKFAGIYFTQTTAPVDAQNGQATPAPSLSVTGNHVTGNTSAWTSGWNSIYFNQGSPKPDGSYPGFTKAVNGTYDKKTHAYEIVWYSQIVGGPFNNFTGYWHLQGTLADGTIGLATATSKIKVKKGKTVTVKVTATNWTEKALAKSKITVKAPKTLKLAAKSKKATVAKLKLAGSKVVKVKLRVGKKAKPGKHKVKLTWAVGGKKVTKTVTVTVKKK